MAEEKKSFFARLREGLTKTRNNIVKGFDSVFSGYSVIDDEFYEELEETMIMGDLGGRATEEILDRLKEQVNDQGICDPQDCREILIDSIREQMHVGKTAYDFEKEQSVVMVIGGKRCRQDDFDWKTRFQVKEAGTQGLNRGGGYVPCGSCRSAGGMGEPRRCRYDRRRRGL